MAGGAGGGGGEGAPLASLSDVPFSTFCAALRSLRGAPARARRGGAAARPAGGAAAEFRRVRARARAAGAPEDEDEDGAEAESRHDVLTRLWKEAGGTVRNVAAARAAAGAGQGGGADDGGDDGAFDPCRALAVGDTLVLLSLLCPTLDEAHPLYMMKEAKIAEHYVQALALPRHVADAQWLLNWSDKAYRPDPARVVSRRAQRAYAAAQDGVFPSVLTAVLAARWTPKTGAPLSVGRVWELLGALHRSADVGGGRYLAHGAPRGGADGAGGAAASGGAAGGAVSDARAAAAAAAAEALGRRQARAAVFVEMVQRASPAENAEFARIVLKDTQVRLGEDVLLRWFHPHARRHYHSTHDLGRLVAQLRDPTFSMDSVAIAPGNYAAVMLTARPAGAGLAAAARRLATGVEEGGEPFFYVEPKLDGERVQLHKMGARVQTFTRSRKDSSEVYARLLSAAVCASVQAEDCILDGEVVLWDETALKWVTFEGMRPTVARMNARTVPAGERYKLKYCVFDVLYVKQRRARGDAEAVEPSPGSQPLTASTADSLDLSLATASPLGSPPERAAQRSVRRKASNAVVGLPLWQRRKLLDSIVQDRTTSSTPPYAHGFEVAVEKVPVQLGRGEAGLVDWLAHFLREGHEGLIAKSPAGEYGMAERDPAKGIKLKPDYFDGGLQDVDVVILGGKYGTGQGRRRGRVGTLSSFLVGVRTESSDEATGRQRSGEVGRWTPVGSVGTGYSLEELRVLQKRLEPHWQDMERVAGRDRFPSFWDTGSQADAMFCDVAKWIDPRKSAVLQVRAYELARRTGYALRFPRCDRIRDPDEKPFYDAISLEELVELDNCKPAAVIRTSGGQDEDEVVERGPVAKRRRNMTARARAIAGLQADKFSVQRARGGKRTIDASRRGADVSDIRAEDRSQALAHHCFHVFASPGRPADADAKHELERRIFLLGGTFDQNKASGKVTHYMARDAGHADVVAICRAAREGRALDAGAKSIVRPEWLGDCEAQNAAVPLKRGHVLLAGRDLERRLLQHADAYGDPWTEATTADTFLACMAEMEARVARGELDADVAEDDPQIEAAVLDGMRASGAVFWGLVAWVPPASRPPPLLAAQLLFKLFGGDVVAHGADAGHPPVTHVLLAEATSPDQCDALRAAGHATAAPDRVLVSDVWVQVCADRERLVAPFVQRAPKFTKAGEC